VLGNVDVVNEDWKVRTGSFLLGVFLLLTGVGLVVALFSLWPAVEAATRPRPRPASWSYLGLPPWTLTPDTALLLLVAVVGGLGSMVHGATSFASYVGNRRLKLSWAWWYVLRILTGASLALFVYFLLRGGLLTGAASTTAVNPYGIAATAGLAGLFSKQAVDKLREVFDTLLRVREGSGDDERSDKIVPPAPVLHAVSPGSVPAGQTEVELTLTGEAFTNESRVSVRRLATSGSAATEPLELQPEHTEASLLRVALPEELTATPGVVEVTVVNPPPNAGRSASLTITVE
jgi:hypothetical protein